MTRRTITRRHSHANLGAGASGDQPQLPSRRTITRGHSHANLGAAASGDQPQLPSRKSSRSDEEFEEFREGLTAGADEHRTCQKSRPERQTSRNRTVKPKPSTRQNSHQSAWGEARGAVGFMQRAGAHLQAQPRKATPLPLSRSLPSFQGCAGRGGRAKPQSAAAAMAEQMAGIIFGRYDRDGSGAMEAAELGSACAELGHPLSEEELARALQALDKDGSGHVCRAEFMRFYEVGMKVEALLCDTKASEVVSASSDARERVAAAPAQADEPAGHDARAERAELEAALDMDDGHVKEGPGRRVEKRGARPSELQSLEV